MFVCVLTVDLIEVRFIKSHMMWHDLLESKDIETLVLHVRETKVVEIKMMNCVV